MEERIYLSSPHMSEEGYEQNYIQQAFDSNWIAPLGENVTEFEKEISTLIGSRAGAALNSGTAAIHMALKAAGVKDGDIVFCQSLTFSATANPIIYLNAIPVFIDSDRESWNMDPELLAKAFLKYEKKGRMPRAVIIAHLYGIPAKIEEILALCHKYNTPLIEDAAESLGSLYKGRYTGTFGEYGTFSFNGNKIITTSGGGMVVSEKEERIEKIRFWASQSREVARHYEHIELGYNYRMSNILAGIGRGQLKVLKDRVNRKREIYQYYKVHLQDIPQIAMMPEQEDTYQNCWLSCITLEGSLTPNEIIDSLEREQIEARPIWKPMHRQPFFKEFDYIGNGISDDIYKKGLCLPSDTKMSNKDLDCVVRIVRNLYGR